MSKLTGIAAILRFPFPDMSEEEEEEDESLSFLNDDEYEFSFSDKMISAETGYFSLSRTRDKLTVE